MKYEDFRSGDVYVSRGELYRVFGVEFYENDRGGKIYSEVIYGSFAGFNVQFGVVNKWRHCEDDERFLLWRASDE